jgi:predicted nucleotidyltransferase
VTTGTSVTETVENAYIEAFKAVLIAEPDDRRVVNEHVLHGVCRAIDDGSHYQLKHEIAETFGLQVHSDLYVVGSAKLGFSINPRQIFKPFDDASDIDVAIVSHDLFERVWHEAHDYKESGADWPDRPKFEQYLAWGWIRPDKFPRTATFRFSNRWWDFLQDLQRRRVTGAYKVRAAIYHDMEFLVQYQMRGVNRCRATLDGV